MDMQIGVFCGVFSIIASLIVYAILSFYSIKEDSFDEAKANRRKLIKEYLDQRTNTEKLKHKKTKKNNKKGKDKKSGELVESEEKKDVLEVSKEVPQLSSIKECVDVQRKPDNVTKSVKAKSQPIEKDGSVSSTSSSGTNENPIKKGSDKKTKVKAQEKKPEVEPVPNASGLVLKENEKKSKIEMKPEKKKIDNPISSVPKKQNTGSDKQVINVNSIISLIQKAELSRSEVQLLIDTLLNSEDETSDWLKVKKLDSSRQDNCVKLRKQLSDLELSLKNEKQITLSLQSKLKELRSEMASDKSLALSLKEVVNKMQQEKDDILYEKSDLSYKLKSTNDEKNELQDQLNKEMAKSQQQQKLDEVHYEAINVLKDEINDVTTQLETIENENLSLKSTISCLEGELNMHQNCQEKVNGLERALNVLSEKLNEKENETSSSKKQLDSLTSSLNKFKKENNTLKIDNEELSDKMSTVYKEVERLTEEVTTLSEKLANQENEKYDNEHDGDTNGFESAENYQKMLEEKENSLKQMIKQMDNNMKKLNELNDKLHCSNDENLKLKSTLDRADLELTDLKDNISKLKTQKSENESLIASLKNHLNDGNSEITMLKEEIEKYKQINNSTDGESLSKKSNNQNSEKDGGKGDPTNGIDSKYESLKLMLDEKDNLLKQMTKQIDNNMKTLKELKQELLTSNEENTNLKSMLNKAHLELADLKENIVKIELNNKDVISSFKNNLNTANEEIVLLKEDAEKYKQRNNELRNKNWKVVQALTDAEKALQNKLKSEENENGNKYKNIEELKSNVNTFVRRIFPEIDIQEYKGHFNEWLHSVEETVTSNKTKNCLEDLQTQNNNLQSLVVNYKKIISDTEQMLNELQNHVEAEESKWREKFTSYQKEIDSLRATQKTSL